MSETKLIAIRLPLVLLAQLQNRAIQDSRSLSGEIRLLLTSALAGDTPVPQAIAAPIVPVIAQATPTVDHIPIRTVEPIVKAIPKPIPIRSAKPMPIPTVSDTDGSYWGS